MLNAPVQAPPRPENPPAALMSEPEYLRDRLDDQIGWYDRRSMAAQWWFKRLRILEVVAAAAIPVLAAYAELDSVQLAVAILGALVALIAALVGLYQYQEHWIEYRSTCESLKHEKFLFLTRTEPYDAPNPFALLVQRVESLISKENSTWAQQTRAAGSRERMGPSRTGSAEPETDA